MMLEQLSNEELDTLSIELQNEKDSILERLRLINKERDIRAAKVRAARQLAKLSGEERDALAQALGVVGLDAGQVGSIG